MQEYNAASRQMWPRKPIDSAFGKRPAQMPRFIWNKLFGMRVLQRGLATCIAIAGGAMILRFSGAARLEYVNTLAPWVFTEVGILSLLTMSFIPWLLVLLMRWRVRTLVRRAQLVAYQVCTTCGYRLCGLPNVGSCPECGMIYEIDVAVRQWESWE